MKKFTLIAALVIAFGSASAQTFTRQQIDFAKDHDFHESIYMTADSSMTVKEAFEFLDMLASGPLWYLNRYVIKDGKTFLRYGMTLTKKRTFVMNGHRKRHVKNY